MDIKKKRSLCIYFFYFYIFKHSSNIHTTSYNKENVWFFYIGTLWIEKETSFPNVPRMFENVVVKNEYNCND